MSVRHPSRGRSIRRSQRTSQRSVDTAKTDEESTASAANEHERYYDESTGGMVKDIKSSRPMSQEQVQSTTDLEAMESGVTPNGKPKSMLARGLSGLRRDRGSQRSNQSAESAQSAAIVTAGPRLAVGVPVRQLSASGGMRLDRVPEDDWLEAGEADLQHTPTYSYTLDDYATASEDEADDYSRKSVPIWLSLCLVIAYIVWGAFIFQEWEGWSLLDASYFCFITLTTIGFGDLVPDPRSEDGERKLALCSTYLLFGIAMIAMSFNLVQEQVINNVKMIGRQLGILKDEEEEEDY